MCELIEKMARFLLANAGPSIQLRVRKEVLGNITPAQEKQYQEQILREPIIQHIARHQKDNGWIGNGFHGSNKNAGQYDNQEVATKYMGEKGLKNTPLLDRAMQAFQTTELTDLCYETRGRYFNEFEIAAFGQNMIRCGCIARAHYDDVIDIQPQIQHSLDSFKRVLEVDSILDVSRPTKKCRLFNKNERWPCKYHFGILAFTDSWKQQDNIRLLADSFQKLMRTDRKDIMQTPVACWIGHAVGPLWYLNEGLSISCDTDGIHGVDLEAIEWMARCGLYGYIPSLRQEVDYIAEQVNEEGVCQVNLMSRPAFKEWGPYSGGALEPDWKTRLRQQCDVTFRALLILYYCEKGVSK